MRLSSPKARINAMHWRSRITIRIQPFRMEWIKIIWSSQILYFQSPSHNPQSPIRDATRTQISFAFSRLYLSNSRVWAVYMYFLNVNENWTRSGRHAYARESGSRVGLHVRRAIVPDATRGNERHPSAYFFFFFLQKFTSGKSCVLRAALCLVKTRGNLIV